MKKTLQCKVVVITIIAVEVLLAGQAAGKPEALVPRDYMLARMPSLHHTPMPSHGCVPTECTPSSLGFFNVHVRVRAVLASLRLARMQIPRLYICLQHKVQAVLTRLLFKLALSEPTQGRRTRTSARSLATRSHRTARNSVHACTATRSRWPVLVVKNSSKPLPTTATPVEWCCTEVVLHMRHRRVHHHSHASH